MNRTVQGCGFEGQCVVSQWSTCVGKGVGAAAAVGGNTSNAWLSFLKLQRTTTTIGASQNDGNPRERGSEMATSVQKSVHVPSPAYTIGHVDSARRNATG